MHIVPFLAKRFHLSAVGWGRRFLEDVVRVEGMTPARFDLLCVLRQSGIRLQQRFGKGVGTDDAGRPFASVVKELGLHPSTVSKMIKRLVEMGWLRVFRDYPDRRFKIVECTPLGLRRTWEAMRRVFRPRHVRKVYEQVHDELRPKMPVVDAIRATVKDLGSLAYAFGDNSTFRGYDYGFTAPRVAAKSPPAPSPERPT
jgi:DNA-binding MarR family transcriptional regulator